MKFQEWAKAANKKFAEIDERLSALDARAKKLEEENARLRTVEKATQAVAVGEKVEETPTGPDLSLDD